MIFTAFKKCIFLPDSEGVKIKFATVVQTFFLTNIISAWANVNAVVGQTI